MSEALVRKVAFLDTNVLHFISLYLRQAKIHSLFPLTGEIAPTNNYLDEVTDGKLRESLNKGLDTILFLSDGDFRVEYSPVSELELMAGRAKGRALEKAAQEGIPDRMWTRFHDNEIAARLVPADLTDIRAGVDDLGSALKEAGIDATVSDSRRTRDVLNVAMQVAALVYMSVMDSIIYASALVAEADHLISDDNYLSTTANRIRTGQSPFPEVRRQLEGHIEEILLKERGSFTLPKAPKVPPRSR